MIAVFSCGHCFHEKCMTNNSIDSVPCPKCQKPATLIKLSEPKNIQEDMKRNLRPDLEGKF